MPPYHLSVSESQTQADILRRLEAVEFKLNKAKQQPAIDDGSGGDRFPGVSFPGPITVGMQSPRWYSTRAISYITARISCITAGGGDGTFALNLNGSVVLSLTLGSGDNTALFASAFSISPGDYIDAVCTAAAAQETVSIQLEESA